METEKQNYRQMLSDELERRTKRNPAYSLRSFARDLKLSVASVSKILSGKQGLSPTTAKKVSKLLELSDLESELFCTLIESSHARAKANREIATKKLSGDVLQTVDLSVEYFKTISEWYYYAILEIPSIASFQSNPAWIAKKLGLTTPIVKEAIARLLKLELLETTPEGGFKKTEGYLISQSSVPNRSFRNHHHQLLKKAEIALEDQSIEERDFSAVTFAMNSEDMAWAKEELKKFRRALTSRLAANQNKNRLYQLNLELFALDEKFSGEKNEKLI